MYFCSAVFIIIYIIIRIIIGSDRRPERRGKIVRFRSCLRHFRFIISCRRYFVQFTI